jgi:hypothetical protein
MSCHFFTVFLFYLWFCTLSFVQIVKELESKMCHHEDAKLNVQNYEQMNEADEDFAPISGYGHHYSKEVVSDRCITTLNPGDYYSNVMARPEY